MNLKNEPWLTKHQHHCLNFKLENNFVKSEVEDAIKNVEKLLQEDYKNIESMEKRIQHKVLNKLKLRLRKSNNVGLLCSGGEDSIYLLMILVRDLGLKPKLLCYQTKNNSSDVNRLKSISENLDLELSLYDKSNLDRYAAYKKFIEIQKRQPNDIAQPVHNALYFKAIEDHGCDVVIDGQFCDTVLLSNPQNHFLLWMEGYPKLLKSAINFLNYLPLNKEKKLKTRLLHLQDLIGSSSSVEHIFKLINLQDPDKELILSTKDAIEKFGTQLTFSMYFFYCLLVKRERDKYLLCPDLFSPFDDFSFAIETSINLPQVLGFFVRKKPIRNLCKKSFPKLFRFQNTLPFEIE